MKHKHALTSAAVALTATLTLAACGGDDPASTTGSTGSSRPNATSTPAQGAHNEADVMFAQGMIPHHAQAVEMSDIVLGKDGVQAEVEQLAREIKSAQAPEIDQMTGWLVGWGEDVPGEGGDMGGMGGMDHGGGDMPGLMSEQDMGALRDASGEQASRLFLEQMIEHHTSAIKMAEVELERGENGDAKALARQIIRTQQAEIETMSGLLAG